MFLPETKEKYDALIHITNHFMLLGLFDILELRLKEQDIEVSRLS